MKITFSFYTFDIIKQRGIKWVKQVFDSIKGQSDDIIVVDYSSTDNIEQVVKSYGFRFFRIEKTPNVYFHMSKMTNKSIFEAKNDLFVRIPMDVIYPLNFAQLILDYYKDHDPKKITLRFLVKILDKNGRHTGRNGTIEVCYRPFLIKGRGIDERMSYYLGEHSYYLMLAARVFKQKVVLHPKKLDHKHHGGRHSIKEKQEKKILNHTSNDRLIKNLQNNFDETVKEVVNSYW